ncbi:hypothetical protein DENSPDRAFT_885658 [Dentipellis sp. KUC8613]|nr:hypothetical protein DENSPDRAFT_885658 [Dentipellis sp. KUC8613]
MEKLKSTAAIWTNATESFIFGAKLPLIHNLDKIAKARNERHPKTQTVRRGKKKESFPENRVVKRGFSGYGSYVTLPSSPADQRKWGSWPEVPFEEVENSWFQQELIPGLLTSQIGEIRCVFAGGKFLYAFHTSPRDGGGITTEHVMTVMPLDLLC